MLDLEAFRHMSITAKDALTTKDIFNCKNMIRIQHDIDKELLKIIDYENQLKMFQTDYSKALIELYIRKAEVEIDLYKLTLKNLSTVG